MNYPPERTVMMGALRTMERARDAAWRACMTFGRDIDHEAVYDALRAVQESVLTLEYELEKDLEAKRAKRREAEDSD